MPSGATVPTHCTKPCKYLSVNMASFKKKKVCLIVPKEAFFASNCTAVCDKARRKLRQWAAGCPQGLIVSELTAQLWPFQQAAFKTKLWQSCGAAHVRVPSIPRKHYGQDYTGLTPCPCTVLQHYPGKLCTLKQAYRASHYVLGHLWLVSHKHQHVRLYHSAYNLLQTLRSS